MAKVELLSYPSSNDWMEVKRRALVTIGKTPVTEPSEDWKIKILEARHSPIRYLRFSFLISDLPYWVSTHLVRHVHAQPYVKSQRNDLQEKYDRDSARQDAPITMIWDMSAEELMVVMNKRLCFKASKETREVVEQMRDCINEVATEYKTMLVPMCEYHNGKCHEMNSCGKCHD